MAIPTINATVGQPLANVNIYLNETDPIAKELEAYPKWLAREVVLGLGPIQKPNNIRRQNKLLIRANNTRSSG